jgi:hypothetical protein
MYRPVDGRTRVLLLAVVVACASAFTAERAVALLTGTSAIPSNSLTTGEIRLGASPTTAVLTASNMIPGDSTTGPITVSNTGSNPVRYAVISTTTENALAGALRLSIKTGVGTCTNDGFGQSGTLLGGPVTFGSTTGVNVLGDPAQGQHAGDRTLAGGASEVLCLQATLPLSAAGTGQGVTTTATLTFDAEQTVNNP